MNSKRAHNMKSQMHVAFVGQKGSRASPIIWFVTLLQDVNRLFIRSSCRKKNQHHIWPKIIIGQLKNWPKRTLNSSTPQSLSKRLHPATFLLAVQKIDPDDLDVPGVPGACSVPQTPKYWSRKWGEFLGTLPPIHLPGFRVVGNCKSAGYGCQLHLGTQHSQVPAKQPACLRFTIRFSEMSNERDWK